MLTTRSYVHLFRIQAVEDGPNGPEFLPDLPRAPKPPTKDPPAGEEETAIVAGGEGGSDVPPSNGNRDPAGPGARTMPVDGAYVRSRANARGKPDDVLGAPSTVAMEVIDIADSDASA